MGLKFVWSISYTTRVHITHVFPSMIRIRWMSFTLWDLYDLHHLLIARGWLYTSQCLLNMPTTATHPHCIHIGTVRYRLGATLGTWQLTEQGGCSHPFCSPSQVDYIPCHLERQASRVSRAAAAAAAALLVALRLQMTSGGAKPAYIYISCSRAV